METARDKCVFGLNVGGRYKRGAGAISQLFSPAENMGRAQSGPHTMHKAPTFYI
jgi:hypothetical protein